MSDIITDEIVHKARQIFLANGRGAMRAALNGVIPDILERAQMTLHRWRYYKDLDEHRCEKCGYVLRPGPKSPPCPITDDYERKAENESTT